MNAKVVREKIRVYANKGDTHVSEIGGGENMFPHEYSTSGWFRWKKIRS